MIPITPTKEKSRQTSANTEAGKAITIEASTSQRISFSEAMKVAESEGDVATALSLLARHGLIKESTRKKTIMIKGA